mgnify:CR=1 FL=1
MTDILLNIKDLCVSYATKKESLEVLQYINLEVFRDEVFGLVGESGSGKSTLASAILGLLQNPGKIDQGQILFDNKDITNMSDKNHRRFLWEQISYIPQGAMNCFNPVIRINEQFHDVIKDHGGQKAYGLNERKIAQLLRSMHLNPDILDKFPHQLSGGMKQRLCIALAIVLNPKLIFADEPTSALDVISQRIVLETLSKARRKLKSSIILIGHDLAIQAQIADRLGIMFSGRLVEIGSVADIFYNPLHEYTKKLISSLPSIQVKQNLNILGANKSQGITTGLKGNEATSFIEINPGHLVAKSY